MRAVVPWDREGTQNDQPDATEERGCHSAPPQGRRNTSNFAIRPGCRWEKARVGKVLPGGSEDKESSGPFDGLPGVR